MPITRTTMVDDDGSGTTGTIINNAWKQEFYNQIDTLTGGTLTQVPYAAGIFTATGTGGWTVTAGNVSALTYTILNQRLLTLWFAIIQSTVTGTGVIGLKIALPALMPAATGRAYAPFTYFIGQHGTGFASIDVGTRTLSLSRDLTNSVFPAYADTWVLGQISFPV